MPGQLPLPSSLNPLREKLGSHFTDGKAEAKMDSPRAPPPQGPMASQQPVRIQTSPPSPLHTHRPTTQPPPSCLCSPQQPGNEGPALEAWACSFSARKFLVCLTPRRRWWAGPPPLCWSVKGPPLFTRPQSHASFAVGPGSPFPHEWNEFC